METIKQIMPLLPERYAAQIRDEEFRTLEEIRIRSGHPLRMRYRRGERELMPISEQVVIEEVLERACQRSIYAYTDTIVNGYVTVLGGHRIGLCGSGVWDGGRISHIKEPSSLNIRIAKEWLGCADDAIHALRCSTLILGPPGCGKTTLLRDLIRQLSDKRYQNVGVADERGELSAMCGGQSQLDLGARTDVMVQIPKGHAMMCLLRTMNPQWIAVDEITSPSDIAAMEEIAYCGVQILATAHGTCLEDLYRRPLYQTLLDRKIFHQVLLMDVHKSYRMEALYL